MRRMMICASLVLLASLETSYGQGENKRSAPYPPKIVASVALTRQGGAIPPTTLVTFTANLYRVNAYYEMVATTPDCGSSVSPTFQWTDDSLHSRSQSMKGSPFECFNLSYGQTVFVAHGASGTPLTYSVLANPTDTIQYSLYITVEQLQ